MQSVLGSLEDQQIKENEWRQRLEQNVEQNSGDLEGAAGHQAQLIHKNQRLIKKAAPEGAAYYGGLGNRQTSNLSN